MIDLKCADEMCNIDKETQEKIPHKKYHAPDPSSIWSWSEWQKTSLPNDEHVYILWSRAINKTELAAVIMRVWTAMPTCTQLMELLVASLWVRKKIDSRQTDEKNVFFCVCRRLLPTRAN